MEIKEIAVMSKPADLIKIWFGPMVESVCLILLTVVSLTRFPHQKESYIFPVMVIGVGAIVITLALTTTKENRFYKLRFRTAVDQGIPVGVFLVPSIVIQQTFQMTVKTSENIKHLGEYRTHIPSETFINCSFVLSTVTLIMAAMFTFHIKFIIIAPIAVFSGLYFQEHLLDFQMCLLIACTLLYILCFFSINWLGQRSFTFGESAIFCQSFILVLLDFALINLFKTSIFSPEIMRIFSHFVSRDPAVHLLVTMLVAAVIISLALSPVFYCFIHYIKFQDDKIVYSLGFYIGGLLNVTAIFLPMAYYTLGANPVFWILAFVFQTRTRIVLMLYWLTLLFFSVLIVIWHKEKNVGGNSTKVIPNILVRKSFHFIVTLIFIPGIYIDPYFMKLASGVALVIMIVAEYVRIFRIIPFGDLLHRYLMTFVDERDQGCIIVTHIYLLLGCALPVWLFPYTDGLFSSSQAACTLAPYAGILSLGVGDAAASALGSQYGTIKWPTSKKTYFGTLSGIIAQFLCAFMVLLIHNVNVNQINLIEIGFVITLVSVVEATTTQIDNIVLPPVMYTSLLIFC